VIWQRRKRARGDMARTAPMADIWIRFYEKSGFKALGIPDFWLGDVMFTYKVYFICLKE